MSDKDLKLTPHNLKNQDAWWYEEPGGIIICSEAFEPDGAKHFKQVSIRWSSLRAALKRKDKAKGGA